MSAPTDMLRYYADRAREYERIYARPERQADLAVLEEAIATRFAGLRVLDVACGTGYFTASAARTARFVTGYDANEETLAIARAKGMRNATFALADAYALPQPADRFEGALTTFWWSHIPKRRIESFLDGLGGQLEPGAPVLIADNTYVEGSSTPISRVDAAGDSYQLRTLASGATFEVLKNFPTRAELESWGERFGTEVEVRGLTYYWILCYRAR